MPPLFSLVSLSLIFPSPHPALQHTKHHLAVPWLSVPVLILLLWMHPREAGSWNRADSSIARFLGGEPRTPRGFLTQVEG